MSLSQLAQPKRGYLANILTRPLIGPLLMHFFDVTERDRLPKHWLWPFAIPMTWILYCRFRFYGACHFSVLVPTTGATTRIERSSPQARSFSSTSCSASKCGGSASTCLSSTASA